jgi:hypothetical protein
MTGPATAATIPRDTEAQSQNPFFARSNRFAFDWKLMPDSSLQLGACPAFNVLLQISKWSREQRCPPANPRGDDASRCSEPKDGGLAQRGMP